MKKTPYQEVVREALQMTKKKGYVTDRDLQILFDRKLLPTIGPFLPTKYNSDIFHESFISAWNQYLINKFERTKGVKQRRLEDPDVVTTVYATTAENLDKAYEVEQTRIKEWRSKTNKLGEKLLESWRKKK